MIEVAEKEKKKKEVRKKEKHPERGISSKKQLVQMLRTWSDWPYDIGDINERGEKNFPHMYGKASPSLNRDREEERTLLPKDSYDTSRHRNLSCFV